MSKFFHSRLFLVSFAALTALFLTGCAFDDRMSTFDPKGPIAQVQFDLFMITVYVCTVIFIIVAASLAWAVFKYRAKPGDENKPMPEQGHGNPLVEIGLIGGSILLLVIIAIPTLDAIWYTHEMPDRPDSELGEWYPGGVSSDIEDEVLVIKAIGYQWWWTFEYPQFGIRTANEMVIPKDKIVRIELRSEDVIHSFWFPKIAGKVDLIPGRANWMWIEANEEGHYYGQCAEFCGEAHAYMLIRADVLNDQDFASWVDNQLKDAPVPAEGSLAAKGYELFQKKTCIQCHRIQGTPFQSEVGPDLSKIASRKSVGAGILDHYSDFGEINKDAQRDTLFRWIRHSEDYKPGNLMYYGPAGLKKNVIDAAPNNYTDEDVKLIVEYLMTLE